MIKQELDFIEYANDEEAQAAYVSSDVAGDEASQTSYATGQDDVEKVYGETGVGERMAQSFKVASLINCTKVSLYIQKVNSPTDNIIARIETNNSGVPSGTLVNANATKSLLASGIPTSLGYVDFVFPASFVLQADTTYWIVLCRDGARDITNVIAWGDDATSPTYTDGTLAARSSGTWATYTRDFLFYVYGQAIHLQCYSESTIKQQGSYSLKIIATKDDSLNDILTKTLSPSLNLIDYDIIKFYVKASRTGTNFQIGIEDSGGITTWKDVEILNDNWHQIRFSLVDVTGENKDTVIKIKVKITNADAENIIYLDNIYAETEMGLKQIIES